MAVALSVTPAIVYDYVGLLNNINFGVHIK